MFFSIFLAFKVILLLHATSGLDNGLVRTPPMGWMSWERFRCNTDCVNDPENCISEHLFKVQAEEMSKGGYLDAGYEYIIIDDCWLSHERDENGKLQPDPDRFPSGIKALADYVHDLGLKFGIYEDYGNFTCGGYPGILGHLETDANTFAEWGVDYIKVDGCYVDTHQMDTGYPEFGQYLNATNRKIVYSCSWPAYQVDEGMSPNYTAIAEHCNLWRNYGDIQDSWTSVLDIINFYAENKDDFAAVAGPGNWNDPDMLIIGNFGLSLDQARVQMALWAIFAAPLIMSNDLRTIRPEFAEILMNKHVIKINQDPLGIQGRRVFHDEKRKVDIFMRPIMPTFQNEKSAAVAVMYSGDDGTPTKVTFTLESIGLGHKSGYVTSDVFSGEQYPGIYLPNDSISVNVNPSGIVLLRLDANPVKTTQERVKPSLGKHHKWWHNHVAFNDKAVFIESLGKTGWLYDPELVDPFHPLTDEGH